MTGTLFEMLNWSPGKSSCSRTCPICASSHGTALVEIIYKCEPLIYFKCQHCGSIYPDGEFADEGLGGYAFGKSDYDLSLKRYVEIGAGIDSLVKPLAAISSAPTGDLLDVGCGFGFLVDLWKKSSSSLSHGIELASYGYWGKELLKAPITHEFLSEDESLKNRTFDIVFSGEVIEHVTNPSRFLDDLCKHISKDGCLVITTPNAEFINPRSPEISVLGSLFPGAHLFLLSPQKLESMIKDAGLPWVKINTCGERITAWAAFSELVLDTEAANQRSQELTEKYLPSLAVHSNEWVRGGALYRLFRSQVNSGNYSVANETCLRIEQLIDLETENALSSNRITNLITSIRNENDTIKCMPCYTGPFLYYRAMLKLNFLNDTIGSALDFNNSLTILLHWAQVAPSISQEHCSLLSSSLYHLEKAYNRKISEISRHLELIQHSGQVGWSEFTNRNDSAIFIDE